jgi:hypothetical protein
VRKPVIAVSAWAGAAPEKAVMFAPVPRQLPGARVLRCREQSDRVAAAMPDQPRPHHDGQPERENNPDQNARMLLSESRHLVGYPQETPLECHDRCGDPPVSVTVIV